MDKRFQKVIAKKLLNRTWRTENKKSKPRYKKYINSPLRNEINLQELHNYNEYLFYKKKIYRMNI